MTNATTQSLTAHFQDSVDTVAHALKAAASGTHEFSEDASEMLSTAPTEISRLAENLRAHTVDGTKDAVRYAKAEVEAHPLASLAAALTAVVAVMGVVAINQRSGHAAK